MVFHIGPETAEGKKVMLEITARAASLPKKARISCSSPPSGAAAGLDQGAALRQAVGRTAQSGRGDAGRLPGLK